MTRRRRPSTDEKLEQYTFAAPPSLIRVVDDYADKKQWSRSQAINNLIDLGLAAEKDGWTPSGV